MIARDGSFTHQWLEEILERVKKLDLAEYMDGIICNLRSAIFILDWCSASILHSRERVYPSQLQLLTGPRVLKFIAWRQYWDAER
jgi:hypothetical protein